MVLKADRNSSNSKIKSVKRIRITNTEEQNKKNVAFKEIITFLMIPIKA
jgi:hypothetical protein